MSPEEVPQCITHDRESDGRDGDTLHEEEFASDILRGAAEIALFLFGDRNRRRKIYHLAATSHLPVFKLGSVICARRSVLLKWVQDQEQRHSGDKAPHARVDR